MRPVRYPHTKMINGSLVMVASVIKSCCVSFSWLTTNCSDNDGYMLTQSQKILCMKFLYYIKHRYVVMSLIAIIINYALKIM